MEPNTQYACGTWQSRYAIFSDINMMENELGVDNMTYQGAPGGGGGGR